MNISIIGSCRIAKFIPRINGLGYSNEYTETVFTVFQTSILNLGYLYISGIIKELIQIAKWKMLARMTLMMHVGVCLLACLITACLFFGAKCGVTRPYM